MSTSGGTPMTIEELTAQVQTLANQAQVLNSQNQQLRATNQELVGRLSTMEAAYQAAQQAALQAAQQGAAVPAPAPVPNQEVPIAPNRLKPAKPSYFTGRRQDAKTRIWLEGVEMYLATCRVPLPEWTAQAAQYLQGDALVWWVHLRTSGSDQPLLVNWPAFKAALLAIFEPVDAKELAQGKLAHLIQQTSVQEYSHRFRQLLMEANLTPDQVQVSNFIRGLKPAVKMHVRLHNPTTLNEAFTLAVRADAVVYAETRRRPGGDRPVRDRDSGPTPMNLGATGAGPTE